VGSALLDRFHETVRIEQRAGQTRQAMTPIPVIKGRVVERRRSLNGPPTER
jgi:hypothetical protein